MKYFGIIFVEGVFLSLLPYLLFAQVSISNDASQPDPSAILDLKSSIKGVLIPRLTQLQIIILPNPANGLSVYCTTDDKIYIYISSENRWRELAYGPGTIIPASLWMCGSPMTDNRDGKIYNTILIGTQCWLAQNMNMGIKIDPSQQQQNNSIIEKYCYNDLESNCNIYGGLYQWDEMMNYAASSNNIPSGVQGVCPTGWHIPSDAEWCSLTMFIDNTVNCNDYGVSGTDVGGKLKEIGFTHWASPNTGATNSSGFTALPGGCYIYNIGNYFSSVATLTKLWTSTLTYPPRAWERTITTNDQTIERSHNPVSTGESIRCICD